MSARSSIKSIKPRVTVAYADSEFVVEPVLKRSWFDRTFSGMGEGSLRAAIFTLVSTAIGLGMLTLPYAFQQLGIITGLVLLMANAIISCWTMVLIVNGCQRVGAKSYSQLMGRTLGFRWGVFTDLLQFFYGFGIVIGYMNALGSIALDIFNAFGNFDEDSQKTIRLWAMIFSGICSIPMMGIKQVSSLATVGFISIFPFFALVVYILIFSPMIMKDNFGGDHPKTIHYARMNDNVPKANCMFLFAYMMHLNTIPVMMELHNPSPARVFKATTRTTYSLVMLYLPVALLGYLAFPDSDKDTFIANLGVKDIFPIILRFTLFYSILISIPLNGIAVVCSGGNFIKAMLHPDVVRIAFATTEDLETHKKLEEDERRETMGEMTITEVLEAYETDDRPPPRLSNSSPLIEGESLSNPNLSPFLETLSFRILTGSFIIIISFCVAYVASSVTDILGIVSGFFSALMMLTLPMFVYHRILSHLDSSLVKWLKLGLLGFYSLFAFFSVGWQIKVMSQPANSASQ